MTTATMAKAEPAEVTREHIELVKRTVAQDATDAELQLYLHDCRRHGVHPLDKLLHFTKRKGKYTPITSIDLLRTRADTTDAYAGSDDPEYHGTPGQPDFAARVTVWRIVQGVRCPFTATARWSEYKPDQAFMWQKMPYLMLGKCAEALALRKAFPVQLAGLYAREEFPDEEEPAKAIQAPAKPAPAGDTRRAEAPAAKPAAPTLDPRAETLRHELNRTGRKWAQCMMRLNTMYAGETVGYGEKTKFGDVESDRLDALLADLATLPDAPAKEERT